MTKLPNHIEAILFSVILLCIYSGCSAPRENPFDPNSSNYVDPVPPSRITDLSSDSLTATGVRLTWSSPSNFQQYKLYFGDIDWDGTEITLATEYRGSLPGVKPAGTIEESWINLISGESHAWSLFSISEDSLLSEGSNVIQIQAPIRDKPTEFEITARSRRISSWESPLDWISFIIEAAVSDSDGIDSVWVMENDVNIGNLTYQRDGLHWMREFSDNDLPNQLVENIVGHEMIVHSLDFAGFQAQSQPFILARVINESPLVEFPAFDTLLITGTPELMWTRYEADFNFTYLVVIEHISVSGVPSIALMDSLIEFGTYLYQIQNTLSATTDPEYYLWSITVVDEFHNTARSSRAKFRVR